MSDDPLKSIALFFFYAFLDENMALQASLKVASRFRGLTAKLESPQPDQLNAMVVHLTRKYFEEHRQQLGRGHSLISFESGWLVPAKLDLSAWKQFHKESPDNEMLAVVWSRILGFSDQAVSEGLGVTVGTVRYRVGNGLRALGATHKFKALTQS